ncbi:cilia- and flagella-associated protein 45-like [Culicoides brevitarsis]|uniref:cilia- and flagella-associated protein 45-like n=1 Tax=Culicoides brevitarsis TaxID=469753 RepID=UPI00307C01B5
MERTMSAVSKTSSNGSQKSFRMKKPPLKSAATRNTKPNHTTSECGHKLNSRSIHTKGGATDNKNMIQIVTQEQIRDLLIPGDAPNTYPTIWSKDEWQRLDSKAHIKSFHDQLEEMHRIQQEREKIREESERRKAALREIDAMKAAKKSELLETEEAIPEEEDEELLQRKILDRAFLAKQEREEEVKKANRVILQTKCHVIRDAQIHEKHELNKEIKNEELKLEKMMLEEAERALKEEDKRRQELKKEMMKHSEELRKQLEQKELIRLKEAELIEEESKKMQQAIAAIKYDEKERQAQELARKKKIQSELQQAKELSTYFKNLEFEEERRAELKVSEYMRQKREREAQKLLEQKIAKDARDKDHERLLQLQQKIMDTKSHREAIVLRRGQEQVEREYRKKEREAAIKKRETDREIAKARAIQLEETKRQRALEIARDEMDFKTTVEKLKTEEMREKEMQRQKAIEKQRYREEIMNQMTERERKKKEEEAEAKRAFLEAIEAEKNRERLVKNIIGLKIKQMKETQIPERFVKDVQKQLNVQVK